LFSKVTRVLFSTRNSTDPSASSLSASYYLEMPSFKLSAAVVATGLFSLSARAQYNIDPSSVPISTRTSWCQSQLATCPLLCLQNSGSEDSTTTANDCDPQTLNYDCVCGNGLTPSLANYSLTVPYFECQEFGNQCVAACNGATSCQSACRANNPCGAQNPTRINVTTTTSVASNTNLPAGATSGTAGVVYNGLGGGAVATPTGDSGSVSGSAPDTKHSGSQTALDLGRSYGLGVVFVGLFAGFALVM